MITIQKARNIAYSWHGGQWTSLYRFASTGSVYGEDHRSGIISEIILCKVVASEMSKADVRELEQLRRFIESAPVVRKPQTI